MDTLLPNERLLNPKKIDVAGWSDTFLPQLFICDLYHLDINVSLIFSYPLNIILRIIVFKIEIIMIEGIYMIYNTGKKIVCHMQVALSKNMKNINPAILVKQDCLLPIVLFYHMQI